jgi:pimeloyl-ACP methyl ester carboxylesterase
MKKLRQIIAEVKALAGGPPTPELNQLLWQLICYPPKMPLRLQQEQLLNEAQMFSLKVNDVYFAYKELIFKGFIWGNGPHKVLITHGWGSKAADFAEMITALRENKDLQIIAFDAPGNGSSEGELSNLLLFVRAIKAIVTAYGEPNIIIGHSLGAMANAIALKGIAIDPALMVSIAPLIRLKENFERSIAAAGVSREAQHMFLKSFEEEYTTPASYYDLKELYSFDQTLNHWLAYDENDMVSPYTFVEDFLNSYRSIKSQNYNGAGHERIIKSAEVIKDVVEKINKALQSKH